MVDGKVNIGLSFTADTSKARQELDKLKNNLNKITTQGFSGEKITAPLQQSVEYAGELKAMLDAATDASGKLNLSKFSNELTKSGKTLADFNNVITTGGKEGVAVMNSLAQQIRSADANATILSGTLKKFFDGLKNTATWTIQSNAIHMVESALSGAYSYAQKLNKGLTDIAIVSDLNTKQLAEFARTANQMAKELSASTSEYVSGALIYYQAGLSDEEVIERTNTTIKLAEASGESAEQISSYMTAIWNNFYDGSKSVEYYADAISYLGAVTAASNADIAEGMQAFSAVADTVGLSFEYGASALTLLRDITQQSASTIGNSLKTIFARLSSVAQGDTLEDGVDLTKYSKALAQVGVNVLDANQNLREMDDILDDLGARWDSLNEAQKVALAQTVGGVRQYNNLISLMDNYEQFQELVSEASGSEGYLNHQAEIYAESWEAAANRVEAAWQGLYQQLIDDKFFIALTNGLAGIVNGITKIVDGLGGIWGLLPAIASLYFTIGKDSSINGLLKIRNTTQEIIYNLREARKDNQNNQLDAAGILLQNTTSAATTNTTLQYYDRLTKKLDFLRDHQNSMTKAQISMFEQDIERIKQVINYLGELDEKIVANELSFMELENRYGVDSGTTDKAKTYSRYAKAFQDIGDVRSDFDLAKEMANEYLTKDNLISSVSNKYTGGKELLQKIANASVHEIDDLLKQFETYLKQGFQDIQDTVKLDALETRLTEIEQGNTSEDDVNRIAALNAIKQEILAEDQAIVIQEQKMGDLTEEQKQDLEQQKQELDAIAKRYEELAKNDTNFSQQRESARAIARGLLGDKSKEEEILDQEKWAQSIQSVLRFSTSITTLGTSFNRLWDSIASGKADVGTITGALMGLGSSIVSLLNMTKTLSEMGGILGWLGTGLHMAVAIGAVLALVAGFKLLKNAQENAYAKSPEGRIEAANKVLENQKAILKDLTGDYKNLQSTIHSLADEYDELGKKIKGSAAYIIALQNYNNQLDQLEDKYGDIFDIIDGIRVINEDKFDNAVLAQMYANQQLAANATSEIKEGERDQAFNNINNFDDLTKKTSRKAVEKDGLSWTTEYENETYYYLDKTHKILDSKLKQYGQKVQKLVQQSGNLDSNEFEAQLKQILGVDSDDDPLYKLFVNRIALYRQSIEALDEQNNNGGSFSLVKSILMDKGLYSISGVNQTNLDQAIRDAVNAREAQLKSDSALEENAINFAAQLGYKDYDINEKIAYKVKEDGTRDTESSIDLPDIIAAYIASIIGPEFVNMSDEEVVNALNGRGLTKDQLAQWREQQRQSSELQWANNEVDAVDGLDHADAGFQSLRESVRASADELERLSENVETDEAALTQVAKAVEQTNKGFDALEKGWGDWKTILKEGLDKNDISDYNDALTGTVDALADIMNISDEVSESGMQLGSIFRDYVAENLDVVEAALAGDTDAILQLQEIATQDTLYQMAQKNAEALGITADEFQNLADYAGNTWNTIRNLLENGELRVGDNINDGPLMDALLNIINNVATTEEEAEKILADMGFDAEVELNKEGETSRSQYPLPATYTTDTIETGAGPWSYPVLQDPPKMADAATTTEVVAPALKIKTAKYVGGGNILTKRGGTSSGANRVKNATKSSGGSSKKPKTADTTRYHEINSKLEQTSHYLDMVNTAEERAYGQKKLDLMDEKIKLLEREAKQYKQLYDEAKRYYDQDRDRLQNQYGAAFNADGSIANYDAWYKQFVDRYNAGGMDDDAWSAFEDAIKKYEDSLKHLNDAEKKYQDDLNKIFDQKLEKIEYRLKTITDIIKLDMDYLDYMIEMLDDDGLDTAEAMAYIAKEIADVTDQYTANKQALADIFKNHEGITDDLISGLYNGTVSVQQFIDTVGNFTEKEIESIKSIMSSMYSNGKDLKKYIEDLYGKLGELSDKFQESLDKQIDKLDHMNDIIDKTRNIIDVMGKDTLGISDELLNRMQRAQIEISKEHLATLMQERDQYKLWLEQLEAQYAIMDPESLEAKALKEQIEAYRKTYEEVEREILDTANMTAEQIQQLYITMIEQTVTEAGNKIAGAVGDFEKLMDAYDKQKDLDDLYLKTYEKAYQTNKLLRDIGKSLDDTANLRMQGKLRDLQEEILGYQQEGKQVTEEQMEERRKYYELLLAEAALEEAQNAKNMVRMTRDNEGNWSYTYTADQGKLDDLMSDYNDKLFAYEDYNQKTLESAQDTLLNLQNEYLEALKNARDEAEVQALQAYYEPMIEHQRNMVDYMLMRNNELADNFNVNADEVATKLDDTVYGVTTGFDSMDKAMATFDEAMRIAKDNVITHLQEMDAEQIALANSVGITAPEVEQKLDDIEQGVKDVHTAVAGDGTDENPGIAKDFDNEFNDALDTLKGFHETMGPIIDGIVEDIGKINNKVTEVISAYSELSGVTITPPDLSGAIGAMNALKAAADGARDAMRNAGAAPQPEPTPAPKNNGGGGGGGVNFTPGNKNVMVKMATGGYTGAFGPEGRMAILHEKELVLNKADTQNLLTTVSFVRDLTRMISLNAADASSGLGNLFMGGVGQGGGYLDQTVTIHAEFPNATNHSEIEEAFSNLIGLASQYAGRKR